ncbi:Rv3235 family protein [Nocardia sp. XZ_19_385]|uniref:Rv3235 family protein n=1 Tax=Nocardia sp. XZ_19_385 TaxID=2769488 RepID=UPI0018908FF4|nr:Rv3235 family protein [Nocardia sp. XZ_19_385]
MARQSLRLALEIVDHHRPLRHLPANDAVLQRIRTIVTEGSAPHRALGVAVLLRVEVTMLDPATAELCARYQRGPRLFALAARMECGRSKDWRLTAFRLF